MMPLHHTFARFSAARRMVRDGEMSASAFKSELHHKLPAEEKNCSGNQPEIEDIGICFFLKIHGRAE